ADPGDAVAGGTLGRSGAGIPIRKQRRERVARAHLAALSVRADHQRCAVEGDRAPEEVARDAVARGQLLLLHPLIALDAPEDVGRAALGPEVVILPGAHDQAVPPERQL